MNPRQLLTHSTDAPTVPAPKAVEVRTSAATPEVAPKKNRRLFGRKRDRQLDSTEMPASSTARQLVEADLTSKAIAVLIAVCLLAGPLGFLRSLSSSSSTTQAATGGKTAGADPAQLEAGEYAIQVVSAWLGATNKDSENLERLVPSATSAIAGKNPIKITDARVASIKRTAGAWAVTVAGTVAGARRYFQLPVTVVDGNVSALSLPGAVAGPQVVRGADNDYGRAVTSSSPLQQTVSAFLAAYLSGDGDVSRYVSPGVDIAPVVPAWATSIEVMDLRSNADELDVDAPPTEGQKVRVLASVEVTVGEQQVTNANYALSLTSRAGRWEISKVDPVPAWSSTPDKSPGALPSGSATPTPVSPPTPTPEEE